MEIAHKERWKKILELPTASAHKVKCSNFDYMLLISFFRYSNLKVKSLIKDTLLRGISNKKLDYRALIIEYGESRNNRLGVETLIKEIFGAVPKEELDFKNLIKSFKTDCISYNIGYSNQRKNVLIAEILLEKFPDELDYKTLIDFNELNDNNVRNLVENILSKKFPNLLKFQYQ